MDVATMVAINNLNMVTVMAVQAANNVITIVNGERMEEDMDGSMLDQYMGKECIKSSESSAALSEFISPCISDVSICLSEPPQ